MRFFGRASLPSSSTTASAVALHAAFALHVALMAPPQGLAASPTDLLAPPAWVQTEDGVRLQRMSDENTKLSDKTAKKIFEAGVTLATQGANEEDQRFDDSKLARAEDRL